ncbi:hypothetical protein [Grimontia hollisae]|uniref:hypothetical protein n=1 Tax=Grimontia hollisae TaxID=673 RepID=UPI0013038DA2|nr:hypothetical protein [Grimontia hollisae]
MNKNVVIHVGPGKTGSSALQAWLNSHNKILFQHGIFYPEHTVDTNGISSGNIDTIANHNQNGSRTLNEKKLTRLLNEFEQSEAHTLLLSSEYFFAMLRPLFAQLPNARYVGFIRDPLEHHESDYNQRVKLHSHYLPFHASLASFPAIDAFARVMDDCKGINLQLRPYGKGLFYGGSIVSDLLFLIAPAFVLPENETIDCARVVNPSYDYATREFKRLLNYFPIQHLELALHRQLQKRPASDVHISVIPEKAQTSANTAHVKHLETFIKHRQMESLTPLLDVLKDRPIKAYKNQDASPQELLSVAHWLEENDSVLFGKICKIVDRHRYFYLDNPAFWAALSVPLRNGNNKWGKNEDEEERAAINCAPICNKSLATFKLRTRVGADVHSPHLLASMGEFALQNGEYQYAERLLTQALQLNPRQLIALQHINAARSGLKRNNY